MNFPLSLCLYLFAVTITLVAGECQWNECDYDCPAGTKVSSQSSCIVSGRTSTQYECCLDDPVTCQWNQCGYSCPSGTQTLCQLASGTCGTQYYCCLDGSLTCQWSECGYLCPSGTKTLSRLASGTCGTQYYCCN